jgi:2-polyprenyl-6-hydroxyphenyl methylase/3-demethylubiquinone-9 3-methyltransferase
MSQPAFDFGQNWKEFSENALDASQYRQAQQDFAKLTAGVSLQGRDFLDIGFGQGLGLLCAARAGARIHGIDINPKCREVFVANSRHLEPESPPQAQVTVGSILDEVPLATARSWAEHGFDIVHSWGVLHHTGSMWQAIENAISLVKPGGHFILAIYNRHWSSPAWKQIKRLYVASPRPLQKVLTGFFTPVIYVAKFLATGSNPLRKERGMNFHYDVVDWIGGYPYEYASRDEIEDFMSAKGFALERFTPCTTPIGCNEFVFRSAP